MFTWTSYKPPTKGWRVHLLQERRVFTSHVSSSFREQRGLRVPYSRLRRCSRSRPTYFWVGLHNSAFFFKVSDHRAWDSAVDGNFNTCSLASSLVGHLGQLSGWHPQLALQCGHVYLGHIQIIWPNNRQCLHCMFRKCIFGMWLESHLFVFIVVFNW